MNCKLYEKTSYLSLGFGWMSQAATYINVLDSNNVIFSLVQTVIHDLKNLLFKVFLQFSPIGIPSIKATILVMHSIRATKSKISFAKSAEKKARFLKEDK